jgi:hypothetical protein
MKILMAAETKSPALCIIKRIPGLDEFDSEPPDRSDLSLCRGRRSHYCGPAAEARCGIGNTQRMVSC